MQLEWNSFDGNGLTGMEAFVNDNFSIHIVKYVNGDGFHWIARSWDENDECTVTGSYDIGNSGWEYLSDAYLSAVNYMEDLGIISSYDSEDLKQPSKIRELLNKALSFGFATLVSLSTLIGIGAPTFAYADENSPDPSDIYVECVDGTVSINIPEIIDTSNEIYYVADSELIEIEQGTKLYDYIMNELNNDCPDAFIDILSYVGKTDSQNPVTWTLAEQEATVKRTNETVTTKQMQKMGLEPEFYNAALASMYHQYLDDGAVHPIRTMGYQFSTEMAKQLDIWENVNMNASNTITSNYFDTEYDYDTAYDESHNRNIMAGITVIVFCAIIGSIIVVKFFVQNPELLRL